MIQRKVEQSCALSGERTCFPGISRNIFQVNNTISYALNVQEHR